MLTSGALAALAAAGLEPMLAGCGQAAGAAAGSARTLTIGLANGPLTFDPYRFLAAHLSFLRNLNGYLLRYDENLTAQPDIAESYQIAPDNTSVTLALRPGLTFHTGAPITVTDVLYGLERAADPARGLQLNGPMQIVRAISAPDDRHVLLRFNRPVPNLLITDLLAAMPVVDRRYNNAAALVDRGASAGPFRMVSYRPGVELVLARFPGYWRTPGPRLERIVYRYFSDQAALAAALESGIVDMAFPAAVKDVGRLAGSRKVLTGYPGALTHCLRLNPTRPPFDNVKVRQAFQRALNREKMVKYALFGRSEVAALPWGKHCPAYDPTYNDTLRFNLDAAAALLRAGGSPAGAQAINDPGVPEIGLMLQILQADLKQIGFNLDILTLDSTTALTRIGAGDYTAAFNAVGNVQKSPSRINTNSIFRTAKNPVWGDKLPKEYVAAVTDATYAVTATEQKRAYDQLNGVISAEAAGLFVGYELEYFISSNRVSGLGRTPDDEMLLDQVRV
jgi:ABC-type transport system substrate-binding protein